MRNIDNNTINKQGNLKNKQTKQRNPKYAEKKFPPGKRVIREHCNGSFKNSYARN